MKHKVHILSTGWTSYYMQEEHCFYNKFLTMVNYIKYVKIDEVNNSKKKEGKRNSKGGEIIMDNIKENKGTGAEHEVK